MVEDVLGCVFTLTAQEQKETFLTLLQEIVKDELSYPVITSINEKLKDIAAEYTNEPDLPVIDDIHVRDILLDSGVSQERAEAMQQAYKQDDHHAGRCDTANCRGCRKQGADTKQQRQTVCADRFGQSGNTDQRLDGKSCRTERR